MAISYKTEVTAEITPTELARLFWNMDDSEQCDFFEELARVVYEGKDEIRGKMAAEMQWHYLGDRMMERPIARAVLGAMSAGIWEHTIRYCDRQFANRDMPWLDELEETA